MPANGTVDERIVEMRIDHQKFESGAKKTISILESLDKGLKSLGKNNTDGFDGVAASLDKVTNKISVFGTIGDQVIRTLTNKAMELVGQMGKLANTLTIDQIGAGWEKYAEKTQGVQTIMAATAKDWEDQGAQMEYVNAQLDRLNWFTDETSYNLLDMVNNIGKFTSSGVDLETAATAMQGIATWAGISGANTQEASRAMYNLSQALGVGAVTQMDWKSIENANMATYEFKQIVLETAAEMGKLQKISDGVFKTDYVGKNGQTHEVTAESFREYLSDKWFDSDVLMTALSRYGDFTNLLYDVSDATGLTASQILKQIDLYKENGKTIEKLLPWIDKLASDEYDLGRRAFIASQEAKTFKEAIDATKDAVSTGWMNIWETIFGNYLEAKEVWTELAETLYNVFAEPVNNLIDLMDRAFNFNGVEDSTTEAVDPVIELAETLEAAGLDASRFVKTLEEVNPELGQELGDKYKTVDEMLRAGAIDAETFQKILEKLSGYTSDKSLTIEGPKGTEVELQNTGEAAAYTAEQLEVYNHLLESGADLLDRWTTKVTEASEEEKVPGGQLFREGLITLMHDVNNFAEAFSGAMDLVFGGVDEEGNIIPWTEIAGDKLYSLIERFHDFTQNIKITEDDIEAIAEKIANVTDTFKIIGSVIGTVFSGFRFIVSNIFSAVKQSGILGSIFRSLFTVINAIITPFRIVIEYLTAANKVQKSLGNITWPERLAAGLSKIGTFIENVANKFNEFMNSEKVMNALVNGVLALQGAFGKISAFLQPVFDKIVGFFTRLLTLISSGFEQNGIVGVFEKLKAAFDSFLKQHSFIAKAFNLLKNVGKALSSVLLILGASIISVIDKLRNFNGNDFTEKHPKLVEFFTNIKNVIDEFIGSIDKYIGKFNTFARGIKDAFLKDGLTGVSASITKGFEKIKLYFSSLSLQKIVDNIKNAFSNLKIDFSGISAFFDGLREKIDISSIGEFFSSIREKIEKVFSDIFGKPLFDEGFSDRFWEFLENLNGVLLGTGVVLLLRRGRKLIKGITGLVEELTNSLTIFNKNTVTDKFSRASSTLLKIAGSIFLVAMSLFIISKIPDLETAMNTITQLLFDLVAVAVVIKMIGGIKNAGLGSFVGVAMAVAILALTLSGLGKLPLPQIEQGIAAIERILVDLALVAALAHVSGDGSLWGFLGIALGVMVIALTLKGLSKMPWEKFETGLGRVAIVLLMLVAFTRLAGSVKGNNLWSLIGVAVTVMILGWTLKSLGRMKWEKLRQGLIAIGSIIGMLSVFMLASKGTKFNKSSFGAFIGMAIAIGVIAIALAKLSKYPWKKLVGAAASIAICLVAVGGAMAMIGKFGGGFNPMSLFAFAVGIAAFVIIAYTLGQLAEYDWKKIGSVALVCVLTLASICGIVAGLGFLGATAVTGTIVLGVILGLIAGIIWGLIELGKPIIDSAVELAGKLQIFAEALKPLAETFASFDEGTDAKFEQFASMMLSLAKAEFWGLIAGLLSKIPNDGAALGNKISEFIEGLKPFLENVKIITAESVTGADLLSQVMHEVTASTWWELLSNIMGGLQPIYASRLSVFSEALKPFLENVKSVTAESVTGARYLARTMYNTMASSVWEKISTNHGVIQPIYASRLSVFSEALKPFLENVKSVTAESVTGARYLASTMYNVAASSGWEKLSTAFGELQPIYASRLSVFSEALKPFLENVKDISPDSVAGARHLASTMYNVAASSGWEKLSTAFGELQPIYASRLSVFSEALKPFLENVTGINTEHVTGAENLAAFMNRVTQAEFWSALTEWINKFKEAHNLEGLSNVASNLTTFVGDMRPFFTMINALDPETFPKADQFMAFVTDINKNNALTGFANEVGNFFFGIQASGIDMGLTSTLLESVIGFINSIIKIRELVAGESDFSFDFVSELLSTITGITENASLSEDSKLIGNAIVNSISIGVSESEETLSGAIISMACSATAAASADPVLMANANTIGSNIAYGISAGLSSSSSIVYGAVTGAAYTALNGFSSTLGIHSPSRVFAALAAYIPAGIAQGIEENSGTAEDSITILASGVVAAMQQAMARVAMIADENFEINPRITPVVDMSNLTSAAGSANSMFGSISTVMRGSIRASTQAVQTTAGSMEHTSYNNTVVSEIEALSGKLDRLGEAITGMQIVLDSGALVGATSHKMDNAFGVMQARKGRGN